MPAPRHAAMALALAVLGCDAPPASSGDATDTSTGTGDGGETGTTSGADDDGHYRGPRFRERSDESGLQHRQYGDFGPMGCPLLSLHPDLPLSLCRHVANTGGLAVADYDGDGWTDVYLTSVDGKDALMRNRGDGTFEDRTDAAGLGEPVSSNGAAWFDADNDGDVDLYLTTFADTRYYLYINDGEGHFSEQALQRDAAVEGPGLHLGFSVAVGDYDRDGWLDLHLTEWRLDQLAPEGAPSNAVLLHNRGPEAPGHFEDVTTAAGVELAEAEAAPGVMGHWSFSSAFVDLDQDGWQDLAVVSDYGASQLFWNQGDGTFQEGAAKADIGTEDNGMGSTFGDWDADGDLDWFVTSISPPEEPRPGPPVTGNRLYENLGNRRFGDATDVAGVRTGYWGWGAAFFDYDNDGDLDLVMTNGTLHAYAGPGYEDDPTRLWQNDGFGAMAEVSMAANITERGQGRGLVTLDYDRDGNLDILVARHANTPVLLHNEGSDEHHFVRVRVLTSGGKRTAWGAVVRLRAKAEGPVQVRHVGAKTHFLGQSENTVHFGLGPDVDRVAKLEVTWPSTGQSRVLEDVEIDRLHVIVPPSL